MDLVKRHLFLVVLVAAVVVLSVGIGLAAWLMCTRPVAKDKSALAAAQQRAKAILGSPLYSPEVVAEMAKQVDLRKKQYDQILDYIRKLGAGRKVLVPNLFGVATDTSQQRHAFKGEYDAALARFMKTLEAIPPPEKADDKTFRSEEPPEGWIYVHPKISFVRPDWVDKPEAPPLEAVRQGQENIWLMEDLVGILARMNQDVDAARRAKAKQEGTPPARHTLADSAVKELIEIKIGGDAASLPGSKMPLVPLEQNRYVLAAVVPKATPGEKAEAAPARLGLAGARAPTLSGRWSQKGFYNVLPFRLVVVVESRYAGELIRRLKGTESFLTVNALRAKPVTEETILRGKDVIAESRRMYGTHGVVRLEVVGESLIFEFEGGRATTPKGAAAESRT